MLHTNPKRLRVSYSSLEVRREADGTLVCFAHEAV
jgi:hypothetical protein